MLDVGELDAFLCLLANIDDERRELESILPPPAIKLPSRVPPPPCAKSAEPFFATLTELPNSPLDNGRNDIAELQVEQALEGKHTIKMGDHHSEQMDDLNSGPATARRPGQCDHDCDTRGCQNRCVLDGVS